MRILKDLIVSKTRQLVKVKTQRANSNKSIASNYLVIQHSWLKNTQRTFSLPTSFFNLEQHRSYCIPARQKPTGQNLKIETPNILPSQTQEQNPLYQAAYSLEGYWESCQNFLSAADNEKLFFTLLAGVGTIIFFYLKKF